MSEEKTPYKKVLKKDLKAYLKGLEANEYGYCNVISNRMITNSMIIESKNFNLLGAILKETTFDFNLFQDDDKFNEAKKKLISIVKSYLEMEDTPEIEQIISNYFEYYDVFRSLISSPFSEYEDNIDFSIYTTKFCLKFLVEESESEKNLPYNLDVLVFGVLSEINRVIKNFGFTKHQLILRLILSFYGRTHEYYRFLLSNENVVDKWEELYKDFKNQFLLNLKSFSLEDEYITSSISLLFEICKEWRLFFMRLLEIPRGTKVGRIVPIPKNVREELDEIVTKLIDSKIEGRKE